MHKIGGSQGLMVSSYSYSAPPTVGVAIANATYAAARRIARFAAPLARNVFPTLDMYRTR